MSHYAFANDAENTPTLWRMPEGSGEPVAVMRRTENPEAFDLLMETSLNCELFPWKCADCDETVCRCPSVQVSDEEAALVAEWHQEAAQAQFEAEQEARMAQYDDDPNPYLGTYSEL